VASGTGSVGVYRLRRAPWLYGREIRPVTEWCSHGGLNNHRAEYQVDYPTQRRHYCWAHLPGALMAVVRDLNRRRLEEIEFEVTA
jgi:hypothetical protein